MQKTALIYHPDYLLHEVGHQHPENKERLIETMRYFKEKGLLEKVSVLTPKPATEEDLLRVHTKEHVEHIKSLSLSGGGMIDFDTVASEKTFSIAKLAAGGVMLAGEVVATGKFNNSFALIRPPGHHATIMSPLRFVTCRKNSH